MTYEKDAKGIPEYAMQPAKAPADVVPVSSDMPIVPRSKPSAAVMIPAEAVYHKEKFICPAGEQRMMYQFEEDILVPDTRADMREILLIDGTCDLSPMQKKLIPKVDDLLNMTGTVVLQTLYSPEGGVSDMVSVTTKVPYKYQWAMSLDSAADAVFSCQVKSVDAMVINERKFRVKISLEFCARLHSEQEFQFFEGLRADELEMKQKEVSLICLGAVKRDEVSIDEIFRGKDRTDRLAPDCILRQEFVIAENYRQVTTEKIVINGFIYVSLLYAAAEAGGASGAGAGTGAAGSDSGRQRKICQHNQRIEFTQFIPLEKDLRGKTWSAVKISFSSENLCVAPDFEGEDGEEGAFRITGEVQTRVELYENRRRMMVTDAYHRQRRFHCERTTHRISGISDGATAETSVREIVSVGEGTKAAAAVGCFARILSWQCTSEKGRVIVTGELLASALWRGGDLSIRAERRNIAFRGTVEMESVAAGQTVSAVPAVKSAWTELINEKQMEINVSVILTVEVISGQEMILLSDPHFEEGEQRRDYPMAVVGMGNGETLWDMAKRYRTTEENIRTANRLEGEPRPGQRILIVR